MYKCDRGNLFGRRTRGKSNKRGKREEIMKVEGTTKSLMNIIRKRQAIIFGHIIRKEGLEHLITTGKIEDM